jgi:hypothetical protein
MNGGAVCVEPLEQVQECNRKPCHVAAKPVDCAFGEWHDWGACGKCAGEKKRFRSISAYPANGGKQCDLVAHEEVGECERKCHAWGGCTWSDWGMWGGCTTKCGEGRRSRSRQLAFTIDKSQLPPADVNTLVKEYESLYARAASTDSQHLQELVVSFCCGMLSIVVVLGLARSVRWSRGLSNNRNIIQESRVGEELLRI